MRHLSDEKKKRIKEYKHKYWLENGDRIKNERKTDEKQIEIRRKRAKSDKYKAYQPDYQKEYQQDPEKRKIRAEAVARFEEKNPEKAKAARQKWWDEHRDDQRERRTEYMRKYRARKKAEQQKKDSDTPK